MPANRNEASESAPTFAKSDLVAFFALAGLCFAASDRLPDRAPHVPKVETKITVPIGTGESAEQVCTRLALPSSMCIDAAIENGQITFYPDR